MVPRARGIAIVNPSCPTKAKDPQTEGGSFFFIRQIPSVVSRNYTMWIIAYGTKDLQQKIQKFVLCLIDSNLSTSLVRNNALSLTPLLRFKGIRPRILPPVLLLD